MNFSSQTRSISDVFIFFNFEGKLIVNFDEYMADIKYNIQLRTFHKVNLTYAIILTYAILGQLITNK